NRGKVSKYYLKSSIKINLSRTIGFKPVNVHTVILNSCLAGRRVVQDLYNDSTDAETSSA
ncbi:MAG: hypothetical protein KAI99_00605, partial [Cyclobacteriaceae bacterium]|nr:hypothetical protein [Cyclobacteriaceae bacterium]